VKALWGRWWLKFAVHIRSDQPQERCPSFLETRSPCFHPVLSHSNTSVAKAKKLRNARDWFGVLGRTLHFYQTELPKDYLADRKAMVLFRNRFQSAWSTAYDN
jgi:hypothetical protein